MKKLAFLLTAFVLFSGFFAIFSEQKVFAQGSGDQGSECWAHDRYTFCRYSEPYPTCRSGGGFCGAAQGNVPRGPVATE